MRDNRIIYTKAKIAMLDIDTNNKGMMVAWNFIRGKIVASKFFSIVFQDQSILDDRGIGGFFTTKEFVNILYISKDYLRDGKLHFSSNRAMAVFLHEASHFLHFISNMGKYTSQLAKDLNIPTAQICSRSNKERYFEEREAWHLSNQMNCMFHIGIQEEIDLANTKNMLFMSRQNGICKKSVNEINALTDAMKIEDFDFKTL